MLSTFNLCGEMVLHFQLAAWAMALGHTKKESIDTGDLALCNVSCLQSRFRIQANALEHLHTVEDGKL